jgi:hypothetical protein
LLDLDLKRLELEELAVELWVLTVWKEKSSTPTRVLTLL